MTPTQSDNVSLDPYSLVPDLKKLITQLGGQDFGTPVFKPDALAEFELLPYCLEATGVAFFEYIQVHNEVLNSVKPTPHAGVQSFGVGGKARLSHTVDNFLEAAGRTQDATTHYFRRHYDLKLKTRQLDKLFRKLDKANSPEHLRKELSEYLNGLGSELRDYRNLSQHYPLITSDPRVRTLEGDESLLSLLLPNNPRARPPTPLVYRRPNIHAPTYMRRVLFGLVRFCNQMCEILLDPNPPSYTVGVVRTRTPMIIGGPFHGVCALDPAKEAQQLRRFVETKGKEVPR